MNEHPEHDANSSLAHAVGQFRRVARLSAADPLRLLPVDPLTWLQFLSAPMAALIDVAPLERLRQAMAGAAAQPRSAVPRSRVQPFDRSAGGMRPRAAAVSAAPPSERERQEAATSDRHQAPSSHARDMSSGDEWPRREAPARLTLAERRAAVRRTIGEGDVPVGPLPSEAAEARAVTGARRSLSNEEPHARGPFPATRSPMADAAVPQATGADLESSFIRRDEQSAPPEEQHVDVSRGTSDNPFLLDEPQLTPTQRNAVNAVTKSGDHDSATMADVPPAVESRHSLLAPAVGSPVMASRVADAIPPGRRVAPPADPGAARRQPDRQSTTHTDLADALFETLYRSGVDLSWP
jgi:hypothetical protein